jgi:hypothetical protein
MGVTWRDGRLAAKQLFDALRAAGVDPAAHRYENLFEGDRRLLARRLRRAVRAGHTVVAMGRKVQAGLAELGIPHLALIHPAARGTIRAKQAYGAHVAWVLRSGCDSST